MTKREWEQRLALQCLASIAWDKVGHDRYAVRASTEARMAGDKIAEEDPGFFDPDPNEPAKRSGMTSGTDPDWATSKARGKW